VRVGEATSRSAHGHSRVLVVWNHVIPPNTSALTRDKRVGADLASYADLGDDLD